MLLFINDGLAVPLSRVYDIRVMVGQNYSNISISYECGDVIWLDSGSYEKKIKSAVVHFKSSETATQVMRNFYRACIKNQNAFYFGEVSANEKTDSACTS